MLQDHSARRYLLPYEAPALIRAQGQNSLNYEYADPLIPVQQLEHLSLKSLCSFLHKPD